MLIDHGCRLASTVAMRAVEIEGGDAMLAEGTCECGPAVHRFGSVISHIFIVVLLVVPSWGSRFATLEWGNNGRPGLVANSAPPGGFVLKTVRF
jgi:hypothetical protein